MFFPDDGARRRLCRTYGAGGGEGGLAVPGLLAPKGAFARGYDYRAATRLIGTYGAK